MRASRLMAHPVAWIQRRLGPLAAAVANPILIATLARFVGGERVGKRRIVLGAVVRPPMAMWSIVGFVIGGRSGLPRARGSRSPGLGRDRPIVNTPSPSSPASDEPRE